MMRESFWIPVILKATLADTLTSSGDTYVCKEADEKAPPGPLSLQWSTWRKKQVGILTRVLSKERKGLDPEC